MAGERAQTNGCSGGWPTHESVEPFKGEPETLGGRPSNS